MAGKGGYQRPTNPAPVSGPGKLSQRTDGGPSVDNTVQAAKYISGMPYGEGQELNSIAQSAPLAAAPSVENTPSTPAAPSEPLPMPVGLTEPTTRPDEPVMAGMPFGDGAGPEAFGVTQAPAPEVDVKQLAMVYAFVADAAKQPDASQDTINLARKLRSLF